MDNELWNATEDILMELGVFPRKKSFEYFCEAVQLLSEDTTLSDSSVFRVVASRRKKSESNVRNTCTNEIKQISVDNFKSVFGNAVPRSVGDFLGALLVIARRRIK